MSIAINPCANRCSSRSCDTIAKHFEHILVLRKVFTTELALSIWKQKIKQVLSNLYRVSYLKQVSNNMPQMTSKLVFSYESVYMMVSVIHYTTQVHLKCNEK